VFPDRAVAQHSRLHVVQQSKNNFLKDFFINPRRCYEYNNNEISVFAGIGFNTLAEIIGRLKTYYGLHLTIFEKGPTLQEQKKCQESSKSKNLLMILVE
jgi:hypothetical protein